MIWKNTRKGCVVRSLYVDMGRVRMFGRMPGSRHWTSNIEKRPRRHRRRRAKPPVRNKAPTYTKYALTDQHLFLDFRALEQASLLVLPDVEG